MISATGKSAIVDAPSIRRSRRDPQTRSGFTLIEIVMVLGLVVLASGLVISNFATLADRGDARTTEEQLNAAIRKARYLAAQNRTETKLKFDKETGALIVEGKQSGNEVFQLNEDFNQAGSSEIKFFLVPAVEGLSRFKDPTQTQLLAQHIRFAPDRSCSPFVVEIDLGYSTPQRLAYDPFSSIVYNPEQ